MDFLFDNSAYYSSGLSTTYKYLHAIKKKHVQN